MESLIDLELWLLGSSDFKTLQLTETLLATWAYSVSHLTLHTLPSSASSQLLYIPNTLDIPYCLCIPPLLATVCVPFMEFSIAFSMLLPLLVPLLPLPSSQLLPHLLLGILPEHLTLLIIKSQVDKEKPTLERHFI
jgi:hypothetical protein